jgi:hypothetical protein
MIQNSLEFNWGKSSGTFHVGKGTITTQHEQIHFLVKSPHELVDEHPIELFPGFTDGINGTNRLTNAYAESGKLAITLSYPRSEHPEYIEDPEGHKVNTGILVLGAVRSIFPGLQEADAQGHSEGGSNASRACLENPEEFRSLIVMGSGGLIENDTQAKIFKRALSNPQTFLRLAGHAITHPFHAFNLGISTVDYILKNPSKATKEAARIASADIRYRFPVLSLVAGIPNGALQFENDSLFPLELVKKSTNDGEIFDIFSVYPYSDATHINPQIHPRTVAAHVLDMNQRLLEIKSKQTKVA